uniref:F-box domain-containing protein n=1 Tax=Strongyloides papillosus TaxID=174720 RepID=A0A0N5BI92_STREA
MDNSEESNVLSKLLQINLVRKAIINHIPSFSDISNLVNAYQFIINDLEREKIERSMFPYFDLQLVRVGHVNRFEASSGVPGIYNLEFSNNGRLECVLNKSRTFFGEMLPISNCVKYSIGLSIEKLEDDDRMDFVEVLAEKLNLNCNLRKNIKSLEFDLDYPDDMGYIILDALSYIEHDNITRISLPVECFTSPSDKYNMINENIFNGFPNLTKIILTKGESNCFYCLFYCKNIFERFVQQMSTAKIPTIFFKRLTGYDIIDINEINDIINIIKKYNIKVKLGVYINCPSCFVQYRNSTYTMETFSPIKKYITDACGWIRGYTELLHKIGILETFENLSELHLKFKLDDVIFNFKNSNDQKPGDWGLRKLNNLKNVKLGYEKDLDVRNSDILNLFYQLFEFTCSMMPRSVEVLQLKNVPDMNDVTAKMITKYMPNIKLLKIKCLFYKESDGLDNFSKLESLISYNYCPIIIPRTLKLLALAVDFVYDKRAVRSDELIFTDNLIRSHYEKFTKRIRDNKDNYILFNGIHRWHLYKCILQEYFY